MLTIEKTSAPDTVTLHLQGDLTIETVAELREALQEVFEAPEPSVQLNAENLATVDFFGIQLLCSAHRTAVVKQKLLTWYDHRPPQINDSMLVSGFIRHCGCTLCPPGVDCMWV